MEIEYDALWGGNKIEFKNSNGEYTFTTDIYVKGFNIPTKLYWKNGRFYHKTEKLLEGELKIKLNIGDE